MLFNCNIEDVRRWDELFQGRVISRVVLHRCGCRTYTTLQGDVVRGFVCSTVPEHRQGIEDNPFEGVTCPRDGRPVTEDGECPKCGRLVVVDVVPGFRVQEV